MWRAFAILPILVALEASASPGTTDPERNDSTIRATGRATVTSSPDRAELDVGVVSKAPRAADAAAENAKQVERVLGSLRRALGRGAQLETVSYALQPDYQHPERGEPKLVGYIATSTLRVTLDDVTRVGAVIDQATAAGANQIQRVRFLLENDAAARQRALRAATLEARANAATIASALELDIVGISSVAEVSPEVRPMYEMAMARSATPIVPATIETTAEVSVTVEVAPRPRRQP